MPRSLAALAQRVHQAAAVHRFIASSRAGRARSVAALVVVLCLVSRRAGAQTFSAPAGGHAVLLGADRVACPDPAVNRGWTVDPTGHSARSPMGDDAIGQVSPMAVAPDAAHCGHTDAVVSLVATGPLPVLDRASVVVDADAGSATVRGHGLRGAVLRWSAGSASGQDACTDPVTAAGGLESCTFALTRGLVADPGAIALTVLPAGARPGSDAVFFDATGRRVGADELTVRPTRVLVARLLPADTSVDVATGEARVGFVHPEAVGGVDCSDATCDVEGNDLVIRNAGAGETLEVHVHLRPHVFLQRAGAAAPELNPTLQIPLQRCPVGVASAAPLRGVDDQRVVVRVGGRCAHDSSLSFSTPAGDAPIDASVPEADGAVLVVIRVDRVESDVLAVTVQRAGTVVGVARVHTAPAPTGRARLELPGRGTIDFVPTNRDARVLLPANAQGALVPLAVPGVYDVRRDAQGADLIRGVDGTAGSVALRLAYRDRTLPLALRETNLAVLTEPIDRTIHVANIPVALGAMGSGHDALVELICGDGQGNPHLVVPGVTASIAYRARDTCHLVLHRERLSREDGAQQIQLTVSVAEADGSDRTASHIDQTISLEAGPRPRVLYLTGVQAEFDRVIVRASLATENGFYAIRPDEHVGVPQVQWSLVFGTDRFRIYATTAIPTGLFRVSDFADSGILTLNAGAIFRAVLLSREGHESPIGLEAGVMWLGITTASANPFGQVAIVAGIGLGVPIANASHATQTSINLHLWAEHEVSRDFGLDAHTGASAWGLIFGPSISIGDIGANF